MMSEVTVTYFLQIFSINSVPTCPEHSPFSPLPDYTQQVLRVSDFMLFHPPLIS